MHSLCAIKSNRVILPREVRGAIIVIQDGKITDITDELPEGNIDFTDVGDLVVMAGVVDPHVHINEPGRTEWEGFDTATRAAIAGGVTTLVEMPLNASPVTTTARAFEQKLLAARGKIHTNCGFWGGVVPGNEHHLEAMIDLGVLGFKAFLTHSGIDEFPNVTEADLRLAMPIIAKHNIPLLVHCELDTPAASNIQQSSTSYLNYLNSRPGLWEDNAIAMMIRLCEEYNCRVHIVHLSSAGSIPQLQRTKEKGLPITVETAQHYLFFNAEEIPEGATQFKCAPPIRQRANNELLWQALKDGIIDFVATDHSPAPPYMKQADSGDFMKAWGGIASLQFALPALWTAAKGRNCSFNDFAKWLCNSPAMLAGLDNKGCLHKGCDADLVVWSPEESFTVTEEHIHHKHKPTPYLGRELNGVVHQTWLKGVKVFDEGKFLHLNTGNIIIT